LKQNDYICVYTKEGAEAQFIHTLKGCGFLELNFCKYCSFYLSGYLLFKAGFDVIKKFKGEKKAIEKMATKFPQIL
jgi:hypothetical protein